MVPPSGSTLSFLWLFPLLNSVLKIPILEWLPINQLSSSFVVCSFSWVCQAWVSFDLLLQSAALTLNHGSYWTRILCPEWSLISSLDSQALLWVFYLGYSHISFLNWQLILASLISTVHSWCFTSWNLCIFLLYIVKWFVFLCWKVSCYPLYFFNTSHFTYHLWI